jgi:hypothetical protein
VRKGKKVRYRVKEREERRESKIYSERQEKRDRK